MRLPLTALCLAVLCAALGAVLGHARDAGPPDVPGVLWPQQPTLEPFALDDARGGRLDEASLRGHWTLLFLGYTHCPDVCPTTLETLKAVDAALAATPAWVAAGQVVFVSVDAERDTPTLLRRYVAYFNSAFRAATAPPERLHLLARQLDFKVVRLSGSNPDEWWYEHSADIVFIAPDLRVLALFEPPHAAADLAARVGALLAWPGARPR